jgi:hypothetical protein
MVIALASFISLLARHFMQYASNVYLLPFNEPTIFIPSCQVTLNYMEKNELNDVEVKMYYTIPVAPDSGREEAVRVVPIVHHG